MADSDQPSDESELSSEVDARSPAESVPVSPTSGEVVPYDFRRPERMTSDQLRALKFLGGGFSRRLSVVLSAYLRSVSAVSARSVEPQTYGEFIRSLPEITSVWVVGFEPVSGSAILEFNLSAAYAIVYSMMGGIGPSNPEERALTEIEQGIVEKATKVVLEVLSEEWAMFRALRFTVKGRDNNPHMLNVASSSEPLAVTRFQFDIGESHGELKLAIPALALDDMGLTSTQEWERRQTGQTPAQRQAYLRHLMTVPFSVAASLESTISSSDVLSLRVGDTLSLGAPATDDAQITVGGIPKFTGRPFSDGNRMRLRLSSVIGAGDVPVATRALAVPKGEPLLDEASGVPTEDAPA